MRSSEARRRRRLACASNERATWAPEAYRLTVRDGSIELAFGSASGQRYAHQVLDQLRARSGEIPNCRIDDSPDFATRGYMLDVSRDRVPARACLERLVSRLSALRYNHLQLYIEHTFAYTGHEPVWRAASPLTANDVAWLDRLCSDHGIELAANQNTFGHMERWLRHEPYRMRAECPDGFEQAGRRRPPTALAPTPENAEFALSLLRELLPHFTSRRVNIGCDEVWELGQGASAAQVAARGKPAVFVEHLRRIAEPLLADGYQVQFWADMLQKAPEAAAPLADAGAVAAIWGYEAPSQVDLSRVDFDSMPESIREAAREYLTVSARGFGPRLESFAAAGFRTWLVPGTSGWNSLVGRHQNACGNLLDAVESGLAHGAEAVLVTEWGDNGHMQPPFATLPALAYGGGVTWCRASNGDLSDAALADAVSTLVGDESDHFGRSLIELGSIADTLGVMQANGAAFFYALVDAGLPVGPAVPSADAYANALARLDAAAALLASANPRVEDGALLVRESAHAAKLARHGLRTLAMRTGLGGVGAEELARERAALLEAQRDCWLSRSRPGGLADSLARFKATVASP